MKKHSKARAGAPPQADTAAPAQSTFHRLLPAVLILAVAAAYANSFRGVMLFDDYYLETTESLHDLRQMGEIITSSRAWVNLTFALNYAIHEFRTPGYHFVNLAIHLAATLSLFGLLRLSLQAPGAGRRRQVRATRLAFAIALLWGLHPLQTQSVTYISQRAESMMGLFYLLTLYAVARTIRDDKSRRWPVAAVLFCGLGMLCKPVMVTAPLLAVLYDRAFWAISWREVVARRWKLHASLAATWLLLFLTGVVRGVIAASPDEPTTVGFGVAFITPMQYLLTQAGVILHYLRLSVWPDQLCLDHVWPVSNSLGDAAGSTAILACLIGLTVWAWRRRPALAFLGIWFFVILLPTSSFIPIQDVIFEHRMYLSLAAVLTLIVLALDWLLQKAAAPATAQAGVIRIVATVLLAAAAFGLGIRTHLRNRDYHSTEAMWSSVLAIYPNSPRATSNLGGAMMKAGRIADAEALYRRAIVLQPLLSEAQYNLGHLLMLTGRNEEAVIHLNLVPAIAMEYADAQLDLGVIAAVASRHEEAMNHFREAIRARPRFADAHFNLACALAESGDHQGARDAFHEALRLRPDDEEATRRLKDLEKSPSGKPGPMSL